MYPVHCDNVAGGTLCDNWTKGLLGIVKNDFKILIYDLSSSSSSTIGTVWPMVPSFLVFCCCGVLLQVVVDMVSG